MATTTTCDFCGNEIAADEERISGSLSRFAPTLEPVAATVPGTETPVPAALAAGSAVYLDVHVHCWEERTA
jgi:hypothetical protein